MPKKTKKEKIISQYRRKLELLKKINLTYLDMQEKSNTNKPQPMIIKKKPVLNNTHNLPLTTEEDKSLIKKYFFFDLKKSLLFSFLIITIQITLSLLKVIK